MAAGMIAHGEQSGAFQPGMRVVEYTGGSTGSSLAMVCAARGYRAHLVTADCFALEKIRTMRAFGAEVEVLESDGGRVTPELFDRFKARIAELAGGARHVVGGAVRQSRQRSGVRGTRAGDPRAVDGVHGFVMGIGTGGCFSGVAEELKRHDPSIRCVAVEPATSRNLSGGPLGGHRLEGIGSGSFLPAPGSISQTRSPPSATKRRSPRHGRWPGARGSSRVRRPGPTSSSRGGLPRARPRTTGRDDLRRHGPQVPGRRPLRRLTLGSGSGELEPIRPLGAEYPSRPLAQSGRRRGSGRATRCGVALADGGAWPRRASPSTRARSRVLAP